eukprot:g37141.t1
MEGKKERETEVVGQPKLVWDCNQFAKHLADKTQLLVELQRSDYEESRIRLLLDSLPSPLDIRQESLWCTCPREVEKLLLELLQMQLEPKLEALTAQQGEGWYFAVFLATAMPASLVFSCLSGAFRSMGDSRSRGAGARAVPTTWLRLLSRLVQQHRLVDLLRELADGSANALYAPSSSSSSSLSSSSSSSSSSSTSSSSSSFSSCSSASTSPRLQHPQESAHVQAAIAAVAALPDLLANVLQQDTPKPFLPHNFFTLLAMEAVRLLAEAAQQPCSQQANSAVCAVLSQILTKIIRHGHVQAVVPVLLEGLLPVLAGSSSSTVPAGLPGARQALLACYQQVVEGVDVSAQEKLTVAVLQWLSARPQRGLARRVLDLLYAPALLTASAASASSSSSCSLAATADPSPPPLPPRLLATRHFLSFLFLEKFVVSSHFDAEVLDLILTFLERTDRGCLPDVASFVCWPGPAAPSAEAASAACSPPGRRTNLLSGVLARAANLWSQAVFARHATWAQQEYLALLIVRCLQVLAPSPAGSTGAASASNSQAQLSVEDSTVALMNGVQARLSSPRPPIRAACMQVAEQLSRILDPSQPLSFPDEPATAELLAKASWKWRWDPARASARCDASENYEPAPVAGRTASVATRLAALQEQEEQEENKADEAQELAEGGDSDLEGETYDLEDDESDLRKVALPRYLRDVLTLFGKKEREEVEAGLKAVEGLMQKQRATLREVAQELARSLLRLETRDVLEEDKWNTLRLSALEMLAVLEPVLTAPTLVERFYSDNNTVKQRLDILTILIRSAVRLAELPVPPPAAVVAGPVLPAPASSRSYADALASSLAFSSLSRLSLADVEGGGELELELAGQAQQQQPDQQLAAARRVSDTRVAARTKRWSSHVAPRADGAAGGDVATVNQFGPVAGEFFWPLVRDVDNAALSFSLLLQDEPVLLSRLLTALGIFVQCAGPFAAATRSMCSTLWDLLAVTRLHAEATVRRNTLFALSRILHTLPHRIFQEDFSGDLEELVAWLAQVTREEPDSDARALARLCLAAVKAAIDDEQSLAPSGPGRGAGVKVVVETQSIGLGPDSVSSSLRFLAEPRSQYSAITVHSSALGIRYQHDFGIMRNILRSSSSFQDLSSPPQFFSEPAFALHAGSTHLESTSSSLLMELAPSSQMQLAAILFKVRTARRLHPP